MFAMLSELYHQVMMPRTLEKSMHIPKKNIKLITILYERNVLGEIRDSANSVPSLLQRPHFLRRFLDTLA